MDIIESFSDDRFQPITCVEMHTVGEPTRIVVKGYPSLNGTLLEKRAQAKAEHDHVRERLMLEPRGHFDMYGAVLIPQTELTDTGAADMGVLFMTNDGYSTMCGHATLALGRFLLDTFDTTVFPRRDRLRFDRATGTARLRLHAPCGLLEVTVPTNADGSRSDPSRLVTFLSVESFVTGVDVTVPLDPAFRWPELGDRAQLVADFSYGGAFYCLVSAKEMGFVNGLTDVDLDALNRATRLLKAAVVANPKLQGVFKHPSTEDLSFLYSVLVVDDQRGVPTFGSIGAETGLCYFADQQIDRSPTGSGVAARVALAYAKGQRKIGQSWTYHSLVSNASRSSNQGFVGTIATEEAADTKGALASVKVNVGGQAYYVGHHTFVVEKEDPLGDGGFSFAKLKS